MKCLLSLCCLSAAIPSAALVIDDFESGPFDAVLAMNHVSQTGLPTSSVLGGTRAAHAFKVGGFVQMTCTAGGTGNLVLNTITASLSDVFWMGPLQNGVPANGPGTLLPGDFQGLAQPVDMTQFNFFRLDYTAGTSDYLVNVHVYNESLSESVSSQFIPLAQGSSSLFVSYNVFSGGGVYDDAGGIRLGIESLDDGFLTIHSFDLVAVPEPNTVAGVGLLSLLLLFRRRRAAI